MSKEKTILIAPAGYGKTYHISECLKYASEYNLGTQLVLTHTHAGVSSINEKLKNANIPSGNYHVETISSFIQKFVLSFSDCFLPPQEDKNYRNSILSIAEELFQNINILNLIRNSYTTLFVDEYQDCNLQQHNIILQISRVLKTHILGDYLQAIFSFDGQPIELNNKDQFKEFYDNSYSLDIPRRWLEHAPALGEEIKSIRGLLLEGKEIDLNSFSTIENLIVDSIYDNKDFKMILKRLNSCYDSILVLHPITSGPVPRIHFMQHFGWMFRFTESIDDPFFYTLAKLIDRYSTSQAFSDFYNVLTILFSENSLKSRINERNFVIKKKDIEKVDIYNNIIDQYQKYIDDPSLGKLLNIIIFFFSISGVKCYRKELYYSLIEAISNAIDDGISVYDSMKNIRNLIRMKGRRLDVKCIATTLLTKGLEYDAVVVINAHEFDCEKNFYVAISRSVKKLIIVSKKSTILPYKHNPYKYKITKKKIIRKMPLKETPKQEGLFDFKL